MRNLLNGKKTYIVSGLGIIYAAIGWYLGNLEPEVAQRMIWEGLAFIFMRVGIAKTIAQ